MIRLSGGTLYRLKAVFSQQDWAIAADLLTQECGDNLPSCQDATPESAERVRYAVLKLSDGSLDELRRLVEHAQLDWRDVLEWAGFGKDVTKHRRWDPDGS